MLLNKLKHFNMKNVTIFLIILLQLTKTSKGNFSVLKDYCHKSYRTTICENINFEKLNITEFDYLSGWTYKNQNDLFRTSLIKFDNCTFKENKLPINFFLFNKNLSVIYVINSNLRTINIEKTQLDATKSNKTIINVNPASLPKHYYDGFQLRELHFAHNKIEEIPKLLLHHFPKLETIDFSYNKIKEIRSDTFSNVTDTSEYHEIIKTIYLYLQNNYINKIENNSFDILYNLKNLNLNSNNLTLIESHYFANLPNLKKLNLSKNNIKTIDSNSFRNIQRLNIFDITYNNIQNLNIEIRTEFLYMNLSNIHSVNFTKGSEVNKLYASQNYITELNGFSNLKYLGALDISSNPIHQIEPNSFTLSSLYYLNLSYTNISNLDFNKFLFLQKLSILDLSFNNLMKFDVDVLYPVQAIRELYLDGNNLTDIDYEDLKVIKSPLSIGLTNNEWNCTFLQKMIKYLNEKNINYLYPDNHKPVGDKNIGGIGCWIKENTKKTQSASERFNTETDLEIVLNNGQNNSLNPEMFLNILNNLKHEQKLSNKLMIVLII